MSDLIFPTVHLNGTSRDDLLEHVLEARGAIQDALVALNKAAPNGRDYYPQGDSVIYRAIEQHAARFNALEGVYQELGMIAQVISDREAR